MPEKANIPVYKNRSIGVEPTAPNAREPAKCPITAISTVLNKIWRIFENISGTLNKKIFLLSEPLKKFTLVDSTKKNYIVFHRI